MNITNNGALTMNSTQMYAGINRAIARSETIGKLTPQTARIEELEILLARVVDEAILSGYTISETLFDDIRKARR